MTDAELTRAVAEKVMGWHYAKGVDALIWLGPDGMQVAMGESWHERCDCCSGSDVVGFDPLTNDSDACQILDKMVATTGYVMMDYHEGGWLVSFGADSPLNHPDAVHANRKRAIVLAALKSVGVDAG